MAAQRLPAGLTFLGLPSCGHNVQEHKNISSSVMAVEAKRVYIGGLPPGVEEADIHQRFSKFGEVSGINIRMKKDSSGEVRRTFAHMTVKLAEADWMKCLKTYNKTRWKGHELIIQEANENFLDRLQKERETANTNPEKVDAKKELSPQPLTVKGATPGTLVEGRKDWVVAKYGQVLPVVHMKRKDRKKVIKVDPSKYVHNVKRMDKDGKYDDDDVAVSELTWNVEDVDSDITRKRKGIFPEYSPKKREKQVTLQMPPENDAANKKISSELGYLAGDENDLETVPLSYGSRKNLGGYDSDDSRSSADTDEIISSFAKKQATDNRQYNKVHVDKIQGENAVDTFSNETTTSKLKYAEQLVSTKVNDRNGVKTSAFHGSHTPDSGSDFSDMDTATVAETSVNSKQRKPRTGATDNNDKQEHMLNVNAKVGCLESATSDDSSSDSLSGDEVSTNKGRQLGRDLTHGVSQFSHSTLCPDADHIHVRDTSHQSSKQNEKCQSPMSEPVTYSKGARTNTCNNKVQNNSSSSSLDSSDDDTFDEIGSHQFSKKKMISMVNKEKYSVKNSQEKSGSITKKDMKVRSNKRAEKTDVTQEKQSLEKDSSSGASHQRSTTHRRDQVQHDLDNKKRLDSLIERQKEAKCQKEAIKKALASVDTAQSKTKIVFDSDDEDEMLKQSQLDAPTQHSDKKTDENRSQRNPSLFQSDSSSDSESDQETEDGGKDEGSDQEMFRIRPEYEGGAGRKLMKLQSRFGQDSRFKMDQRFLDSDSDENEMPVGKASEGTKVSSEREKNLEILKSIVGTKAEMKQQKKHFKDISTLHYDPTRKDHSQFELKPETVEGSAKPKDKKKKKKPSQEEECVENPTPVPKVSKERFYEVSSSLRDVFGGDGGTSFSLLAQFGSGFTVKAKEETEEDHVETERKTPTNLFGWKTDVKNSSDEEKEDTSGSQKTKKSGCDARKEKSADQNYKTFFMKADDPRIKEGINSFYRSDDMEVVRSKWEKTRPKIIELYRLRRKRALRRKKPTEEVKLHTKKKFSNKNPH